MKKTVLILAGGKSQRFQLFDKCFVMLKHKPLIQHTIDNVSSVADELIVAARDIPQGDHIRDTISSDPIIVVDTVKDVGPLAGILSGLARASFSYSLVVGCDMPFINRDVVDYMFEVAEQGDYDTVVPRWEDGMVEPLHAVYNNESVLAAATDSIKRGDKKLFNLLQHLKKVKYLPVARIREIDPALLTFQNVNTPAELEKYASLVETG